MHKKLTLFILLIIMMNVSSVLAQGAVKSTASGFGALQMIIYLMCFYLIYKGLEIFQIALMSNREDRFDGFVIGIIAIIASIIIAVVFINLIDSEVQTASERIKNLWLP